MHFFTIARGNMCFFSQSGLFKLKIHNINNIPNCHAFYLLIIHFREENTTMCSILRTLPPNCNLVFNTSCCTQRCLGFLVF
jgi:hypothetical protein